MRALGIITATLATAVAAVAVVVGVKSIPDLKRYARMRSM